MVKAVKYLGSGWLWRTVPIFGSGPSVNGSEAGQGNLCTMTNNRIPLLRERLFLNSVRSFDFVRASVCGAQPSSACVAECLASRLQAHSIVLTCRIQQVALR